VHVRTFAHPIVGAKTAETTDVAARVARVPARTPVRMWACVHARHNARVCNVAMTAVVEPAEHARAWTLATVRANAFANPPA